MRLTSVVPSVVAPPAPSRKLDDAVMRLDWAHEAAGTAVSDAEYIDVETLTRASEDATEAAGLLNAIDQAPAAAQAMTAARHLAQAATSKEHDPVDVSTPQVQAHGEAAEAAIHAAFAALGMPGRGE